MLTEIITEFTPEKSKSVSVINIQKMKKSKVRLVFPSLVFRLVFLLSLSLCLLSLSLSVCLRVMLCMLVWECVWCLWCVSVRGVAR